MLVAELKHVTKEYQLGSAGSSWRGLIPGPRGEPRGQEVFTALADVSLRIGEGEALGIVGPNGAGKSTILKVLAGVVQPSSGSVQVAGRIAPIIELGVGFNPDLSGRENLRFGAALLGRTESEVDERYEWIVDFSGLERFMETPVKRYSTGMRARLGFALATAFKVDLLLIDEVLSVGDHDFQQRSMSRLREMHADGAALIAVSHSNWMISQLCDTLVLLEGGRVVCVGDPVTVINRYVGEAQVGLGNPVDDDQPIADLIAEPDPESPVRIENLAVTEGGVPVGGPLDFSFDLFVDAPVEGVLVMSIYSMGRAAFAEPEVGPSEYLAKPGIWRVSGRIEHFPLAAGAYHLRVAVIPQMDSDDQDQEYLSSLARSTVPLLMRGEPTSRPGLRFDTAWEVSWPADVRAEVEDS